MNTATLEAMRKSLISFRESLCYDYENNGINLVSVGAAVVQLSECVEDLLTLELERRREQS